METMTDPTTEPVDRFMTSNVLTTPLPSDLQSALGAFVGREAIETLDEWTAVVRQYTREDSISVDELCHADDPTPHWGELDGDRYHFVCFYDAVLLSALADQPVDIRTESPDGTVIEARAVGHSELSVTPEEAVFSFGMRTEAAANADGEPTIEELYSAGCPYVKAFPDREAYERWAETVPASTVATPLSGATDLAAALIENS
jgi:hypothetical protein